ncbi:MAG: hypothetical protein WC781_04315 [Candidatus Pacearchaeota archaeon]|jgi:hypothetical protein
MKNLSSRSLASLLIGAGSFFTPAINSYSYADEAQNIEQSAESVRNTFIKTIDNKSNLRKYLKKSEPGKYQELIQLENKAEEAFHIKDFSNAKKDYEKATHQLANLIEQTDNIKDFNACRQFLIEGIKEQCQKIDAKITRFKIKNTPNASFLIEYQGHLYIFGYSSDTITEPIDYKRLKKGDEIEIWFDKKYKLEEAPMAEIIKKK